MPKHLAYLTMKFPSIKEAKGKNLYKQRKLRITTTMSPITMIQICFWGLLVFSMGIVVGFVISGSFNRNIYAHVSESHKRNIREEIMKSRIDGPQVLQDNAKAFVGLPEKFKKYVEMKPPVSAFNLFPWKTAPFASTNNQTGKKYFGVFVVKSAAATVKRRFLVRQTWGSIAAIEGNKFGIVFLVGLTNSPLQQDLLDEENKLYGDILQGDIPDTYRGLPHKTLMGYQWVAEYVHNSTRFVIFTDDDCFISVINTFDYFNHIPIGNDENGMYCGYVYSGNAARINNSRSKWFVPDSIYDAARYPKFCHGGMTIVTPMIATDIYREALVTNYTGFHLEDVLITGILREKLGDEGNGANNVYSVVYKNTNNKRYPLVWHLGSRKNMVGHFESLWKQATHRFDNFSTGKPINEVINPLKFNVNLRHLPTAYDLKPEEMSMYFQNKWQLARSLIYTTS